MVTFYSMNGPSINFCLCIFLVNLKCILLKKNRTGTTVHKILLCFITTYCYRKIKVHICSLVSMQCKHFCWVVGVFCLFFLLLVFFCGGGEGAGASWAGPNMVKGQIFKKKFFSPIYLGKNPNA